MAQNCEGMETTAKTRKKIVAQDMSNENWPAARVGAMVVARIRDQGVTVGWRLKNIGMERLGLWLVHKCHRGSSTATG